MRGIRIVNIEPQECPEVLTAQEVELVRAIRDMTPERLARLVEMIEVASEMYREGMESPEIVRYLERNYGA